MVKRVKHQIISKIICLEGIHGVGKTTAFQILKKEMGTGKFHFFNERIASKPIYPFGSKDKQIAFKSEVHYMQQMIERNNIIEKNLLEDTKQKNYRIYFLDRSAISVLVYSRALQLDKRDLKVFDDYFRSVNWFENILIYLKASPETILKRITHRETLDPERLEWNEDDLDYIRRLARQYDATLYRLENRKKIEVIQIDTDDLEPEQVAKKIRKELDAFIPKINILEGQKFIDTWIHQ